MCYQYWPRDKMTMLVGEHSIKVLMTNWCSGYIGRVISIVNKVKNMQFIVTCHNRPAINEISFIFLYNYSLARLNSWFSFRYRTGILVASVPTHRPSLLWWRRCTRYSVGLKTNPLWSTAGQMVYAI